MSKYNKDIPEYGDVMTIEEWNDSLKYGMFTTYDGIGYFCKDNKMSNFEVFSIEGKLECVDATHVCWFNK